MKRFIGRVHNTQEILQGDQDGLPGWQGFPQEAIDSCEGLDEGDSFTFSGPMGDASGTCSSVEGILACDP